MVLFRDLKHLHLEIPATRQNTHLLRLASSSASLATAALHRKSRPTSLCSMITIYITASSYAQGNETVVAKGREAGRK
jgi:hypothetical protein